MSGQLTRKLLYGSDSPLPEATPLRAGGLTVEFEDGDLRYVRAGALEVVRRIYASVRDVNWNTIPGEVRSLSVDARPDSFRVTFDSRHQTSEIDFEWMATIDGSADGVMRYAMEGKALRSFRYCRVGLCMLHPILATAGRSYRATTPQGAVEGAFPSLIAPQPFVDGLYLPLFPSFSALSIDLGLGGNLTCEFEGDLFEIEDQRNWTDGSFKTYCTPASLGFPFRADAGQRFFQRITIGVSPGVSVAPAPPDIALQVGPIVGTMPSLGFARSSVLPVLGDREIGLIRALRPGHLRVDLHLGAVGWERELELATHEAAAVGASLEVAVFVTDDAAAELARLAKRIIGVAVARYLVFYEPEANDTTTAAKWIEIARQRLATASPGATFVGGTNGNFAEINRDRATPGQYDAICYTVNPQVHASDVRSLVEAIDAQGDTVRTAHAFFDGGPVVVSTVTLKPPFNQAATEEEPVAPGELPPEVDARQMSMFNAAWTTGSIRALAASGASSVTYYETAGWRGLFETAKGSAFPARFPSTPGMVFPVYGVFAALADAAGASVLDCRSTDSLALDGLAMSIDGHVRLLVANLTIESRRIRVRGLSFTRAAIRRLRGPETVAAFAGPPGLGDVVTVEEGRLDLELGSFDVVRVDEARAEG